MRLVLPLVSALLGLMIVAVMLRYAGYGFDFTDDGFYLVRIAYPFDAVPAISHFGIVYYPFYVLMHGSIIGLRAFNLLTTFGSAVLLSWVALTAFSPIPRDRNGKIVLALSALGLGSTALALFNTFLITPNYNSLALQALMLTCAGLILVSTEFTRASACGWALVAVGGWLALLAKPSTAGALAIIALFYLVASGKFAWRPVFICGLLCTALVGATSLILDGSVWGLVSRIQAGLERTTLLDDGHTIGELLRLDPFAPTAVETQAMWLGFAMIALLYMLALARHPVPRLAGIVLAIAYAIIAALVLLGIVASPFTQTYSQHLILLGPLPALIIVFALRAALHRFSPSIEPEWRARWSAAGLLVLTPFMYTFGSLDNYWYSSSSASLFWALAIIMLVRPFDGNAPFILAAPTAIGLQALTAFLINNGFERPYRQPEPLRSFEAVALVGPLEARVNMTEPFAAYIAALRDITERQGFQHGTPLIDLSGQSPGALFAIGASNLGQAWMIGGYRGSAATAEVVLRRQSCLDLSRAWILTEPNGPRSIPDAVLTSAGVPIANFHSQVDVLETPPGGGGYKETRKQFIYRPTDSTELEKDCLKRRS